jgi:hypothetical protein
MVNRITRLSRRIRVFIRASLLREEPICAEDGGWRIEDGRVVL